MRWNQLTACSGDAVDIRNNNSWQMRGEVEKKGGLAGSFLSLPVYSLQSIVSSYIPPFSMSISTPNKRSTPPELQPLVSRTTGGTTPTSSSSFSSFRDKMVRALSPNRDSGGEVRGGRRPSWGGEWLFFGLCLGYIRMVWRPRRVLVGRDGGCPSGTAGFYSATVIPANE